MYITCGECGAGVALGVVVFHHDVAVTDVVVLSAVQEVGIPALGNLIVFPVVVIVFVFAQVAVTAICRGSCCIILRIDTIFCQKASWLLILCLSYQEYW